MACLCKKNEFYLTQTQAELTESIVIIRANANKTTPSFRNEN
jgi:hypothetical protein